MATRARWGNRFGKRSAVLMAAASAAASFTNSLWAGDATLNTFTYTGGTTSWTNLSAWIYGTPFPNGVNATANFTFFDLAPIAPTAVALDLDLNITLGALIFQDTNSNTPGGWT